MFYLENCSNQEVQSIVDLLTCERECTIDGIRDHLLDNNTLQVIDHSQYLVSIWLILCKVENIQLKVLSKDTKLTHQDLSVIVGLLSNYVEEEDNAFIGYRDIINKLTN